MIQAGPWIIATQPARTARARRDLCPRLYVAAIAYPHPPCMHAPRFHTQTYPPSVSAPRTSLVLFSRALCACRHTAIAIALACPHPPRVALHILLDPEAHTQTGRGRTGREGEGEGEDEEKREAMKEMQGYER